MGQDSSKSVMEDIVGEVVEMGGSGTDDLNISALDPLDSTTSAGDDHTRDYAAGYAVIIKKLMDLGVVTSASSSAILETKNMVIDLAHNISTLNETVAALKEENVRLVAKMQAVSDKQDTVVTATSTYDRSIDDILETESKSSTHTRQVSSTVPACIIRSFWYKHNPDTDMGVDMKYLRPLCDSVFPKLESQVKSQLGVLLSKHIDNYEHNVNVGDNMMMVLCSKTDVTLSDGRIAIIRTMRLLGTSYAFMLPRALACLLSRVEVMDNCAVRIVKAPRMDEIIGLGEGYDVVATKLIDQPKVRKGIKRLNSSNATKATIKSFIKCIAAGRVQNDGKMLAVPGVGHKAARPLFPAQGAPSVITDDAVITNPRGSSMFDALRKSAK